MSLPVLLTPSEPVEVPIPIDGEFVEAGLVWQAGSPKEALILEGAISPHRAFEQGGRLFLWCIGADGRRPDDNGPAHRRMLELVSDDAGATWAFSRVVKEWAPNKNLEGGVFNSTAEEFSAITAANDTTTSVWCDVLRIADNSLVMDHLDRRIWGWGDELFVLAVLPDGRILYIAKSGSVHWGLGERWANGKTSPIIDPPRGQGREVVGGGAWGWMVVLVRGLAEDLRWLEFYDARIGFDQPVRVDWIGAQHVTPYWDGRTWWLFGLTRDGTQIRRWKWVAERSTTPDTVPALSAITFFDDPAVRRWARTSRTTHAEAREGLVALHHMLAGQFPRFQDRLEYPVGEGNIWVIAWIPGVGWIAKTFEWLRVKQQTKDVTAAGARAIGGHAKGPLINWVPRDGELIGLFTSTRARDNWRASRPNPNAAGKFPAAPDQRTDIWWVRWNRTGIVAVEQEMAA